MNFRSALAVGLPFWMLPASLGAASEPSDLKAVAVPNKLGLTLHEYRFSWLAPGQQSYRVLVASDERRLALDVGDLWDSGQRMDSLPDKPVGGVIIRGECLCRGKAFEAGSTVWWKLRTWDQEGVVGNWSKPQQISIPVADVSVKAIPRPTFTHGAVRFVDGKDGKAVAFSDQVRISAADYGGLRRPATTIAAWIKPERLTDSWQCIYRKDDGARRLFAIGREGPFWGLWCGFSIGGKYVEFGAPYEGRKLGDEAWHHVAVTFAGEMLRLYVDGVMIGEQRQPGTLSSGGNAPAFIGSDRGRSEFFHGGIDDLRIYEGGLTKEQIAALSLGQPEGIKEPLVAHWKFDGEVSNEAVVVPEVTRNRIVLLGGSLVYGMEKHGFFESAVLARWPHHEITVRNVGWPGDDVAGTARGEFQSARGPGTWRPRGSDPGAGYQELLSQVRSAKPTTMMVGYGAEAAYLESEAEMKEFQIGYRRLLDDLETTGANLILLTPVPQSEMHPAPPAVARRNVRLRQAARFIREQGLKRRHEVIDLQGVGGEEADNYRVAIDLTEKGYRDLSSMIAHDLDLNGQVEITCHEDGGGLVQVGGKGLRIADVQQTKNGARGTIVLDQLPSIASPIGLGGGKHLYHDGNLIGRAAKPPGAGVVEAGPDLEQAEALRRVIVRKNGYHRAKIRPLNKTYIFLFRRHEMGHFAHEMEEYEDLVEGAEEQMALLRVPRAHRHEFRRLRAWSAPRQYPDHEVPKQIPAPDVKEELSAFKVAEGFQVNLFAKDPMIANPINLNWDLRGRAWVSTSSTYPHPRPGEKPNDRIVILEDTDEDGVADKHTVFAEGLLVPHSVMPVPGGAYVCSATEVLFLTDSDGDDVAESREVIFSGFGNADVHHMIHGLRWAPWGDLHFTQSIYINSFIDTVHGPRRINGSGIWRLRPETLRLEPFATGMVNPWGFAFNRWGQSFATDGAAGQGPHYVFPGSAFRSAVGAHRVLDGLIRGKPNNTGGEFVAGRHLPEHWQGSFLGNDFRANRTVRYELEESGSGYRAEEVETVLHSSHRSFRPVDIKMGPRGAIYVVDWYNAIIDHGEVDFYHPLRDKSHGRIWRITAEDRPLLSVPAIAGAPLQDLLDLLKTREPYTRTQVKRELASRPGGGMMKPVLEWVENLDRADPHFEHHRLEALWLLMGNGVAPPGLLEVILRSPSAQARAAAVRAAAIWDSQAGEIDPLGILGRAANDEHPQVRLEAVNGLRGVGSLEAANLALRALDHPADNNLKYALELTVRHLRDQWLPAMESGKRVFEGVSSRLAYALREVNDPRAVSRLVELVSSGGIKADDLPQAVVTISALGEEDDLRAMVELAGRSPDLLIAVARGVAENGRVPGNAKEILSLLESKNAEVARAAAELAGMWKLSSAQARLVIMAGTPQADPLTVSVTCRALGRLEQYARLKEFSESGRSAVLRSHAVAAWAQSDPSGAAIPAAALLAQLKDGAQAGLVIESFLAHERGPGALSTALERATLPKKSAIEAVRRAYASGREVGVLIAVLNKAGSLKPLSQDLSSPQRRELLAEVAERGDIVRGREIFERKALACTTCHLVNNRGGVVGPDLTSVGAYATPESLLESLLNPSSMIKQGYETAVVTRNDGTSVAGLLQRKTESATLMRDPTGKVIPIPSGEISRIDRSPVSLMPPGLTAPLRRDELIDLMRYLTSLGRNP